MLIIISNSYFSFSRITLQNFIFRLLVKWEIHWLSRFSYFRGLATLDVGQVYCCFGSNESKNSITCVCLEFWVEANPTWSNPNWKWNNLSSGLRIGNLFKSINGVFVRRPIISNYWTIQDIEVLADMSTYVRKPRTRKRQMERDWQIGEWCLEKSKGISFTPLNFLETTIPELVSSALQHFVESDVPVVAKFSHIALFQKSEESSDADYVDNKSTASRGERTWTGRGLNRAFNVGTAYLKLKFWNFYCVLLLLFRILGPNFV